MKPIIFGCVGIGGYAVEVSNALLTKSQVDNPLLRLAAVCDPALASHPQRVEYFRGLGVTVLPSLDELLALPLDAVWLPVPIYLHRPFMEKALLAGKAVLCEKPAAGSVQDVDAMIAARDSSGLTAAVGFQDIYMPAFRRLKRQLLDGLIGTIHSVTLTGCWPRSDQYYARNDWAGKLKKGDVWVLDSPANNALAHHLHLAMFLLGESVETGTQVATVQAELYRVNPIENYDTCSLRITTTSGQSILVMLTHACRERIDPKIVIHGSDGTVNIDIAQELRWSNKDGDHGEPLLRGNAAYCAEGFANWLLGRRDEPLSTLEMARAHAVVVNAASEAAAVCDVPEEFVRTEPLETGGTLRYIAGIEKLFETCVQSNSMPHESGLAKWTSPAGRLDVQSYSRFKGPKTS